MNPTAPVRAAVVDATDQRGGWTPAVDTRLARLASPVRDVLEPTVDAISADRITIVPDAHYPFHPSTGVVTDPAVVGAIVARLEDRTDADIAVAGVTDEYIDFDRTAQYLGYPSILDRFDAELIDLADEDEPRTDAVHEVDGWSVTLSVPERLAESAVVTVPSLRPTADGSIAGGMRRLGACVDCAGDPDVTAIAATRAIDPVGSVMDATMAYGDDPYAANALFAGPVSAVDTVGTSLFERSIEEDEALRLTAVDGEPVGLERVGTGVDALDLGALRNRLSGGTLPPSDATHPAVTAAYRLYAAVGGDAVPPQLEQ